MALENKVITAHNLHNLMVQFEDLTAEGFRLNRKVASRRSMGNRFTVALVRGEEEVVEVKTVDVAEPEISESDVTIDVVVAPKVDVADVWQDEPEKQVPKKVTRTKPAKAETTKAELDK